MSDHEKKTWSTGRLVSGPRRSLGVIEVDASQWNGCTEAESKDWSHGRLQSMSTPQSACEATFVECQPVQLEITINFEGNVAPEQAFLWTTRLISVIHQAIPALHADLGKSRAEPGRVVFVMTAADGDATTQQRIEFLRQLLQTELKSMQGWKLNGIHRAA